MTYLSKDNDSGQWQFRKRTPQRARRLIGRTILLSLPPAPGHDPVTVSVKVGVAIKLSVRTENSDVARIREAAVREQLARYISAADAEPKALSHLQRVALAGDVYEAFWAAHQHNPGNADAWAAWKALSRAAAEGRATDIPRADLHKPFSDREVALQRFGENLTAGVDALAVGEPAEGLERRFGAICDWVLSQRGITITDEDRRALLSEIAKAAHDAAWRLKRAAEGDYTPDPKQHRFPKFESEAHVSMQSLFDRWAGETKPSPSTLSSWKSPLASLRAYLKHDDAKRVTDVEAIGWKDSLVASGLSVKTINDGHLAAMKTVWTYGIRNRLLTINPFTGVKAAGRSQAGKKELAYTTEEVQSILRLAQMEEHPARRWLPVLAACTGTRISEVAQLWGQDIEKIDGIYVIHIRPGPDGGRLKNPGSERNIPIHSALLEDGFLEFLRPYGNGPVFYRRSSGDPAKRHASKSVAGRVGKWIRSKGFDDPRKGPNNAFRHWFKTVGHEIGLQDSVVDALQGHANKSIAGRYRSFSLSTLRDAIERIPVPKA